MQKLLLIVHYYQVIGELSISIPFYVPHEMKETIMFCYHQVFYVYQKSINAVQVSRCHFSFTSTQHTFSLITVILATLFALI